MSQLTKKCYNVFEIFVGTWFIFYLCSCSSPKFLYRTATKATFNVKDNINNTFYKKADRN